MAGGIKSTQQLAELCLPDLQNVVIGRVVGGTGYSSPYDHRHGAHLPMQSITKLSDSTMREMANSGPRVSQLCGYLGVLLSIRGTNT